MITIRADEATFEHGAMILPPKYLEWRHFVSVWAVQPLREKQTMHLHVRNGHKRIPNRTRSVKRGP